MNKYLNPVNYLNYFTKKIKAFIKIREEKNINNINYLENKLNPIKNVDELLNFHFGTYSDSKHINKDMFEILVETLFRV